MSKLSRVCGHNCFPGGENCNGYCEGKADAPQTYDVSIEHLLNKVAAKNQNIDMLLLSASNEITELRAKLAAEQAAHAETQAREQQLRYLIKLAYDATRGFNARSWLEEALAFPADHSALDAYVEPYKLDAERLDWIQKNARCDPKMDGQHVWWPTNFNKAIKGPTIRDAIDNELKRPQGKPQ